jgi:hypothetical protein
LSWPILAAVPRSFALSNTGSVMPVSMSPGHTALTRTPVPPNCHALVCASEMTDALLAE